MKRMSLQKLVKIVFVGLGICFFLGRSTQPISAHVLQSDGDVGAVLHIDPDDDPIANSPATLIFELKDRTDKFQPSNCDCSVTVLSEGKNIFSQAVFQNNSEPTESSASILFTFPQKGVYQVVLAGKPKQENTFQPFSLTYDIRVSREVAATNSKQQSAPPAKRSWVEDHLPIALALTLLAIFAAYSLFTKFGYSQKDKKP